MRPPGRQPRGGQPRADRRRDAAAGRLPDARHRPGQHRDEEILRAAAACVYGAQPGGDRGLAPAQRGGQGGSGDLRASVPVAGLWTELLGRPEARREAPGAALDDDFFASGGDSLLAMRLVSAIRAQTGRAVTVEDVFAGRTLAGIGARIASAPAIEPVERAGRRDAGRRARGPGQVVARAAPPVVR